MKYIPLPSIERLEEIFDIDYQKGFLIRKRKGKGRPLGVAGCFNDRYPRITVDGKLYLVHRVIWAMVNKVDPGEMEIDHINRDKHDNRPCNLRLATRSQQMANIRRRRDSACGCKGVKKEYNKWVSTITVNKAKISLGSFDSIEEASQAYWKAAQANFGEYAYHDSLPESFTNGGLS